MSTAEQTVAICPSCGVVIKVVQCRFCGAMRTINDVSGNVIWMRNGRIVSAFADEKEAWVKMAARYSIPSEQWPEKFRG